jgi:mannose-6-phosphate isomerase class I
MNRSTVHQAEAFLKNFEETIEELKQEEISDEARDLQAELDKLSIKFDDETFFKLASMAGVTGTELPDKMETINQIMEVMPYDVSEWILIEFLNNLMVQQSN